MKRTRASIVLNPLSMGAILFLFLLVSISPLQAAPAKTIIRVATARLVPLEIVMKFAEPIAKEMDIDLQVSWFSLQDIWPKLLADSAAGVTTWDIVFIGTRDLAPAVEHKVICPLDDFINNPKISNPKLLALDDFFPTTMKVTSYKGAKRWILPVEGNAVQLAYRKDWFDNQAEKDAFKTKYGHDLVVPRTYKEFYEAGEFFTRKRGQKLAGEVLANDTYGLAHSNKPVTYLWHDFVSYLVAFGADVIYNEKTMKPTFNSPESIAAGKFYVSLVPFMPPGHANMTSGASTSLFAEGRVAMILEYSSNIADICENTGKSKIIGKYEVTDSPTQIKERPNAAHVAWDALGIYALSKNKETAYKLLEKALSPENMRKMTLEDFYIPPRTSVVNDPEIIAKRPYMKRQQTIFKPGIYHFSHPNHAEYNRMMDITVQAVSEALAGTKSVEKGFDEAQKKLQEFF